MNITEFAETRNVKINAVSNYLSRHPEIKKHTVKNGKETELTPQAVEMLDKVYPVPKPVQIVTGVDPEEHKRIQVELEMLRKKYDATLEKIAMLQEERFSDQEKLIQAEAKQLLLEDKEKQLAEEKEQRKIAENSLSTEKSAREAAERHVSELEKAIETAENGLSEANAEVERLRNRSLWHRILND